MIGGGGVGAGGPGILAVGGDRTYLVKSIFRSLVSQTQQVKSVTSPLRSLQHAVRPILP
jgi:hypothetical protein